MLRSVLTIALALALGGRAGAQTAPATQTFQAYCTQQSGEIQQLVAAKQYPQALAKYAEWHRAYDQLDPTTRQNFASLPANLYYNEACYHSLAKDRAGALVAFRQAVGAGYKDYAHTLVDTDLDYVRADKDFKQQLALMRTRGDYRYILQHAQGYAAQPASPLPAFTYQAATEPQLVGLRRQYKLDSIAGKGSDVSQVINLMHWVHDRIQHDGQHGNPASRNAQDLLAVCQQENRGLNCRGLATVLNETYLAMGFQSRFVGCLPKDSTDVDSHVINSVYVPSQHKWLYLDPTQDAYVTNEQGQLLSVAEVRERLISGQPLLLNPTANWNHKVSATRQEYLERYMAKNLYQLERPIESRRDLETRRPGEVTHYVRLVPVEAFDPKHATRTWKGKDITIITHYTTDSDAFWQLAPPVTGPTAQGAR
ncbi:MAG: transglutaminase-like domain-containing protein [Janthinobacterium lividum]